MTTGAAGVVYFIVESGTDARLVEGLAARLQLRVLARAIPGGRAISQPTSAQVTMASPGRLGFACRVFTTVLRASANDAVLVQGYGLAALAANLASRWRGLPCWMLVCSPVAEYYETRRAAGAGYSALTLAGIRVLARLNGVAGRGYIVLSRYLAGIARRDGPGRRIHVIPVYGVDVSKFANRGDRDAARIARGLPGSGAIIFSSSRVAPEKDTGTLIAAFAALVREGRDVYLLHRSGGFREFLEHATALGIGGRVIATDAVDPRGDLALDYAASDVCVQASRAEGLGFSVLEAFACGTPVVASAVGGLVETVQDGLSGWTAPPGDAGALAAALRAALDDPFEARRRAAAGGAMVRQQFDSVRVFDQLAAVLTGRSPN